MWWIIPIAIFSFIFLIFFIIPFITRPPQMIRANDVAHKSAVDQIFTSLQAYYTEFREYPSSDPDSICYGKPCTVPVLVGDQDTLGTLVPYIDEYYFNGGSNATYFYAVGGEEGNQSVLVCVTMEGNAQDNYEKRDGEVYCNGNGLGIPNIFPGYTIDTKTIKKGDITFEIFKSGGSEWDDGWID